MTEPVTAVAYFPEWLSSMRVSRSAHIAQASGVVHSAGHGTRYQECTATSGGW